MNKIEDYFYNNTKRVIHKWTGYFEIYERYFNTYVNKNINILEIGVQNGGSAQMWRDYFGDGCKIYGIDINDQCKSIESDWLKIYIGNQSDRNFLNLIKGECPKFDIIIDDGGHISHDIIVSFEELFPHLKYGGVYLCEDLHANYFESHGGLRGADNTFTNYLRKMLDEYHLYSCDPQMSNSYIKNIMGIYFHESVVVIEKCYDRKKSESIITGNDMIIKI